MTRIFFTVFATIFLAEIGDKTQLATMLYAADSSTSKWIVFAGASAALVSAAAIAVLIGSQIDRWVSPRTMKTIAGIAFIGVGIWTLVSKE